MQQKNIHVQPYNTKDKTTNATENEEQDNSTVNEIEAQEKKLGMYQMLIRSLQEEFFLIILPYYFFLGFFHIEL